MLIRASVFALAAAGAVSAQQIDVEDGRALYMTYCWQCHGSDGSGNGPMAEILAVATPDLTRLAAAEDGEFPIERVARQIDGRAPLLSHGGEMPIYGDFLDTGQNVALALPSGQPMMTGLSLANLLTYLNSLQRE